jgi:tetratricopeptide (TPR) repeat protein
LRDEPDNAVLRAFAVRNLYQIGGVHFQAGRTDAAAELLPRVQAHTDRLVRADPLNFAYGQAAVQVCIDQARVGRYADALAGYERLVRLLEPEAAKTPPPSGVKPRLLTAYLGAATCHLFVGAHAEATAALDRVEPLLTASARPQADVLRRVAEAQAGRHAAAADGLEKLAPTDRSQQRIAAWGYAAAFVSAGSDPALSSSERITAQTRYADAAVSQLRKSLTGPATPQSAPMLQRLPAFVALASARPDAKQALAEIEVAARRGTTPAREVGPMPRAGR